MDMDVTISAEKQILEAAEQLFLDKGFAMTSTTEIAKKVGCNQALIHYYFRTKENLFLKLFEAKFVQFVISIDPLILEGLEFKEKLKVIINSHIELIEQNPKIPFLFLTEVTTNPQRLDKIKEEIKKLVIPVIMSISADLISEARAGRIRSVDPFHLIFSIISMDVFMFIARPLLEQIREFENNEFDIFIEERKAHIFELVWNSIKID